MSSTYEIIGGADSDQAIIHRCVDYVETFVVCAEPLQMAT